MTDLIAGLPAIINDATAEYERRADEIVADALARVADIQARCEAECAAIREGVL